MSVWPVPTLHAGCTSSSGFPASRSRTTSWKFGHVTMSSCGHARRVFDCDAGGLRVGDALVELGELAPGELSPAVRVGRACSHQLLDLRESEPDVGEEQDGADETDRVSPVAALPGDPGRRREQSDLLVVPERGRRRTRAPRQLADGESLVCHALTSRVLEVVGSWSWDSSRRRHGRWSASSTSRTASAAGRRTGSWHTGDRIGSATSGRSGSSTCSPPTACWRSASAPGSRSGSWRAARRAALSSASIIRN